jgi:hypothetical protein
MTMRKPPAYSPNDMSTSKQSCFDRLSMRCEILSGLDDYLVGRPSDLDASRD